MFHIFICDFKTLIAKRPKVQHKCQQNKQGELFSFALRAVGGLLRIGENSSELGMLNHRDKQIDTFVSAHVFHLKIWHLFNPRSVQVGVFFVGFFFS